MNIQWFDSDEAPKPRDEVRIEQLEVVPYPDRFRVFVHVKVTPFQERPNLLLSMYSEDNRLVSELSVIETMHADMEFTMHLRNVTEPAGMYTLTVELFYETRKPAQDEMIEAFEIPTADDEMP